MGELPLRVPYLEAQLSLPTHERTGYESGYGYCLSPYGTAYRRALRTTRTRVRTRGAEVGAVLADPREVHVWHHFEPLSRGKPTSGKVTVSKPFRAGHNDCHSKPCRKQRLSCMTCLAGRNVWHHFEPLERGKPMPAPRGQKRAFPLFVIIIKGAL